jgi:hypothetical protein
MEKVAALDNAGGIPNKVDGAYFPNLGMSVLPIYY